MTLKYGNTKGNSDGKEDEVKNSDSNEEDDDAENPRVLTTARAIALQDSSTHFFFSFFLSHTEMTVMVLLANDVSKMQKEEL